MGIKINNDKLKSQQQWFYYKLIINKFYYDKNDFILKLLILGEI